jgi:hypothetical protein
MVCPRPSRPALQHTRRHSVRGRRVVGVEANCRPVGRWLRAQGDRRDGAAVQRGCAQGRRLASSSPSRRGRTWTLASPRRANAATSWPARSGQKIRRPVDLARSPIGAALRTHTHTNKRRVCAALQACNNGRFQRVAAGPGRAPGGAVQQQAMCSRGTRSWSHARVQRHAGSVAAAAAPVLVCLTRRCCGLPSTWSTVLPPRRCGSLVGAGSVLAPCCRSVSDMRFALCPRGNVECCPRAANGSASTFCAFHENRPSLNISHQILLVLAKFCSFFTGLKWGRLSKVNSPAKGDTTWTGSVDQMWPAEPTDHANAIIAIHNTDSWGVKTTKIIGPAGGREGDGGRKGNGSSINHLIVFAVIARPEPSMEGDGWSHVAFAAASSCSTTSNEYGALAPCHALPMPGFRPLGPPSAANSHPPTPLCALPFSTKGVVAVGREDCCPV